METWNGRVLSSGSAIQRERSRGTPHHDSANPTPAHHIIQGPHSRRSHHVTSALVTLCDLSGLPVTLHACDMQCSHT
eukprot:300499-Rhodomonas_salina.1